MATSPTSKPKSPVRKATLRAVGAPKPVPQDAPAASIPQAAQAKGDVAVTAATTERTPKASRAAGPVADRMTSTLEQAFATTNGKYETVMQNLSDISAAGRENMDAVVSAGTVLVKGVEAVNAELASISRRNIEDGIAAVKALAAARSAKEYFELQSELVKTSWDHAVADTGKLGEMMGAYSRDVLAPIQSRITAAMEQFSKPPTP